MTKKAFIGIHYKSDSFFVREGIDGFVSFKDGSISEDALIAYTGIELSVEDLVQRASEIGQELSVSDARYTLENVVSFKISKSVEHFPSRDADNPFKEIAKKKVRKVRRDNYAPEPKPPLKPVSTRHGIFTAEDGEPPYVCGVEWILFDQCRCTLSWPEVINGSFVQADYELYTDESYVEYDENDEAFIEVSIHDPHGNGVREGQLKTLDFIKDNIRKLEERVFSYLPEIHKMYLDDEYRYGELKSHEDEQVLWKCMDYLRSPEGVIKTMEICGIDILDRVVDGEHCFTLNFYCGWDEEHGVAILFSGDEAVEWNGLGDYYNK